MSEAKKRETKWIYVRVDQDVKKEFQGHVRGAYMARTVEALIKEFNKDDALRKRVLKEAEGF